MHTRLLADAELQDDAVAREILPVLLGPTGTTSAGWPYLDEPSFEHVRDRVPHILGMGTKVEAALRRIVRRVEDAPHLVADRTSFDRAVQVVDQIVRTAAVTAPPTLWLARHVLHALEAVGVLTILARGEALRPDHAVDARTGAPLSATELELDLTFLHVLGLVDRADGVFRGLHLAPRTAWPSVEPDLATVWTDAFLSGRTVDVLVAQGRSPPRRRSMRQRGWTPLAGEVELGARVLPVVLGLHQAGRTGALAAGGVAPDELGSTETGLAAMRILQCAGLVESSKGRFGTTPLGQRVLTKGVGPFGIIGAYHPFLARLSEILCVGHANVHVTRGTNVAASQRANKAGFRQQNDALDRFCADTGFRFTVFIEHALGRGEATRQRWQRSGDGLAYVGADLEDDAIDAARAEQSRGNLPRDMTFVRHADIGEPATLLDALRARGLSPLGAVMMVGNGFHEVRGQTDERMVAIFRAYAEAGIVLLFTEETALTIEEQRQSAWNTYHPGFRYVHEKSGQGLRPADPRPAEHRARELPASWTECATRAGYALLERYAVRGRTIYPTPQNARKNPPTSVSYFAVPRSLAR